MQVIDQLNGAQLRALWKRLSCEFTPEAWGRIEESYIVAMQRCRGCNFVFFEPSIAGNETFYRQLERPEYFPPARPEFDRALELARRKDLRRVLDVGCGSGAFLDLAREAGRATCGLELNQAAAQKVRAKGHTVFERLLGELDADQTSGRFDLITFFQVLEHVPDPVAVLRQAATLLSKGGYICAAVPSAEGVYGLVPWDPHQWPPHHVSRWRLADFEQLARSAKLKLVESGGDYLLGSHIQYFWKLHNQLAPALGKPPRWGGDFLPNLISFVYRKTGMKFFFPRWGCSIYAHFQTNEILSRSSSSIRRTVRTGG